jgi:hypothetical protein
MRVGLRPVVIIQSSELNPAQEPDLEIFAGAPCRTAVRRRLHSRLAVQNRGTPRGDVYGSDRYAAQHRRAWSTPRSAYRDTAAAWLSLPH